MHFLENESKNRSLVKLLKNIFNFCHFSRAKPINISKNSSRNQEMFNVIKVL